VKRSASNEHIFAFLKALKTQQHKPVLILRPQSKLNQLSNIRDARRILSSSLITNDKHSLYPGIKISMICARSVIGFVSGMHT